MEINSEKIKICSICENKTSNWQCNLVKKNIFSIFQESCPLNKWDKGFFPTSIEAKEELIQLGTNMSILDNLGAVKIENFDRGAFSAQFKKKNLELKPNKNLISGQTKVEDVIYCIENFPPGGWNGDCHKWENVQKAYRQLSGKTARKLMSENYPKDRFFGKGIVICGGGPKYYPSIYVNARMLRLLGCKLPIEVYYIGVKEMDINMISILESIGNLKCIDATGFETEYPIRIHAGWESKVYSIINSSFQEVLMLDADNTPLIDPSYLFNESKYLEQGAILWPDYTSWKHDSKLYDILGIKFTNELQVESGQVLLDKSKCWKEINMAKYYCDYSDYYFKHFYGDKEAFHFGWRFFGSDYAQPPGPDWINNSIIVQKDLAGSWLFSHRAQAKFKLNKSHKISMEMPHEQDTLDLLDELKSLWSGQVWINKNPNEIEKEIISEIVNKKYNYIRVKMDSRNIELLKDNKIGIGADKLERSWYIFFVNGSAKMSIYGDKGLTALLTWDAKSKKWLGKWLDYEKCDLEIVEI